MMYACFSARRAALDAEETALSVRSREHRERLFFEARAAAFLGILESRLTATPLLRWLVPRRATEREVEPIVVHSSDSE